VTSLLFVLAAVFAGWAGAQPTRGISESLLGDARCEAAVREQLASWETVLDRALGEPAGPTGGRSARVPTAAIGLWVRIVEVTPRDLAIERVTATRVERRRFDEDCAGTEFVVASTVPPAGAFGDSDLITRIARDDRGVVLLWSPHMPLSVDQHTVLAPVARELGLTVVPLLDPAADAGYAVRVAQERNLPPEAARPLGGVELAFRGMTTRTPSLQVFAGGRLIGPVLYGYRSAEPLRAALAAALEESRLPK
jgi:hypothetical protein